LATLTKVALINLSLEGTAQALSVGCVSLGMLDQYTSNRIVLSLRTRSRRVPLRGSQQISIQLENHWSAIRVDQITKKLAKQTNVERLHVGFEGCGYDLNDAREALSNKLRF